MYNPNCQPLFDGSIAACTEVRSMLNNYAGNPYSQLYKKFNMPREHVSFEPSYFTNITKNLPKNNKIDIGFGSFLSSPSSYINEDVYYNKDVLEACLV
jgi:hypothetical protein